MLFFECRLQEQLLEVRARESKLAKEREGLEGQVARLEGQRARLDAELAQMRKMLAETGEWVLLHVGGALAACLHKLPPPTAFHSLPCPPPYCPPTHPPTHPLPATEARCQATHKQAMEAANEAKRLAPLEPKAARLEEAVHAAHAELERVQREVTAHQSSIRQASQMALSLRCAALRQQRETAKQCLHSSILLPSKLARAGPSLRHRGHPAHRPIPRRKLLEEKSTALELLAARSQALEAAQQQMRELAGASRDRLQLAEDKAKVGCGRERRRECCMHGSGCRLLFGGRVLAPAPGHYLGAQTHPLHACPRLQLEEELHSLRQRCSATERLQGESMHQLTVARRLLADAHSADERAKLAATQQELQSSKVTAAAQRRESVLLKDRLAATEGQLEFMEKQLQVAVHSPLAAAVAAATSSHASSSSSGAGGAGGASAMVVEQLRRLLDTKEDRIRWVACPAACHAIWLAANAAAHVLPMAVTLHRG